MPIRAVTSGRRSSPVAAQPSTVSSRSSAALPLPPVPQPLVLQDRRNGDSHVVLCVCLHLCHPGQYRSPPHSFLRTAFHMAGDQPGLLAESRSLGIMGCP